MKNPIVCEACGELGHTAKMTCSACGEHGHKSTNGLCSASHLARQMNGSNIGIARELGVSSRTVSQARSGMGLTIKRGRPRGRQSVCSACGESGHNAKNGVCSSSHLATQIDGKGTYVAKMLGIAPQTVRNARSRAR